MDKNVSLLTRQESSLLKGILILLIVLGHNAYLMHLGDSYLKDFLYAFHVSSFFYLTCMYNVPVCTVARIKKDWKHLYIPYTILFVLFACVSLLISDEELDLGEIIWAYISGNSENLAEVAGFQYLWFMPAMFAFLVLRLLFFNYRKFSWGVLFVSFVVLLLNVMGVRRFVDLPEFLPFGLYGALANFFLAVVFRFLLERNYQYRWFRWMFPLLFLLVSVVYFLFHPTVYCYFFFCSFLIPFFAFPTLFVLVKTEFFKSLRGVSLLEKLGKYSFPIYLFHQIIYNLVALLYSKVDLGIGVLDGLIVLFLTLFLTIFFIRIFARCLPKLYSLFS